MSIIHTYTTFRAAFSIGSGVYADDGFEIWPVEKLRIGGFTGGFTGITKPIPAFPIIISCNGGIADSADANSPYRWYLSQRTDDTAKQYFTLGHDDPLATGTVELSLTALAVSALGLAGVTSSVSEDQLVEALKHCHLYVQREKAATGGDDAIQWVDLLQETLSDV